MVGKRGLDLIQILLHKNSCNMETIGVDSRVVNCKSMMMECESEMCNLEDVRT